MRGRGRQVYLLNELSDPIKESHSVHTENHTPFKSCQGDPIPLESLFHIIIRFIRQEIYGIHSINSTRSIPSHLASLISSTTSITARLSSLSSSSSAALLRFCLPDLWRLFCLCFMFGGFQGFYFISPLYSEASGCGRYCIFDGTFTQNNLFFHCSFTNKSDTFEYSIFFFTIL